MQSEIVIAIIGSSGAWAVISALLNRLFARVDARRQERSIPREEFEAMGRALRGLLYGELERRCTAYIQAGRISASELNDLRRYYFEPYKELRGDGTIDRLMQRVEQLDLAEEA